MANPTLEKLAERLKKATPDELVLFAERLAKRADCVKTAMGHLAKAVEQHEKLGDHLDNLKDGVESVKCAMGKAAETGELHKAVSDSLTGAITAHEGIGKAHEDISGSLEEYGDEANSEVDAGIAAATRHPDKMFRAMSRQMEKMQKQMLAQQKASDRRLEEVVKGFTGGFEKAMTPPTAVQPMRTALTVEKSADGSGNASMIKIAGPNGTEVSPSSVSPVMADGVTPNPDFTKLAEAQGEAVQKALRSAQPQVGDPFSGIHDLVGRRA